MVMSDVSGASWVGAIYGTSWVVGWTVPDKCSGSGCGSGSLLLSGGGGSVLLALAVALPAKELGQVLKKLPPFPHRFQGRVDYRPRWDAPLYKFCK